MTKQPHPIVIDPSRLAALRHTSLLDAATEARFDKVTKLASALLNTPVSLLSLVDADRQFFASQLGLPEPYASLRETPLTHSFCQYVVETGEPLIVEDARAHPVLNSNCAVTDLGVIAYLGAPVRSPDGHVLGSLCAIGAEPRAWTNLDVMTIKNLAEVIEEHIALRAEGLAAKALAAQNDSLHGSITTGSKTLFRYPQH